jgi:hypothetical protein
MTGKQLSILILLLHTRIALCSAPQRDVKANCATQMLQLSVSHIQNPKNPQIAQHIVDLLDQKCPTSSARPYEQNLIV